MPYIPDIRRQHIDAGLRTPVVAGELAYVIYKACLDYCDLRATFDHYNGVVGVLENVKHEFQRRVLDPYEDEKRKQNGDVFSEDGLRRREYGGKSVG